MEDNGTIRKFETGATRDTAGNKNDYEGFLSPLVIEAFGDYMNENRLQKDGTLRDSDNWQKGIPLKVYIKSGWRHFFQWWKLSRGLPCKDENGKPVDLRHAICGLLFNAMGYLHESLKAHPEIRIEKCVDISPSKVTTNLRFPRFFHQSASSNFSACVYVIVAPLVGQRFSYSDNFGWVDLNWRLDEMVGDLSGWGSMPYPVEITAEEAVKLGVPNNTDTWPEVLRKEWLGGRRLLLVDDPKDTKKESVLND